MNLSHARTVLGVLRLISIVVGIFAALIGILSYYLSNYNRNCHGMGNSFPTPSSKTRNLETALSSLFASQSNDNKNIHFQQPSIKSVNDEGKEKDTAPVLWMERFSFSVVWAGLIISTIFYLVHLTFGSLDYSKIFKLLNFVFHFVWAVLLIVSAIFVGYAAYEIDKQICQFREFEEGQECQKYILKMVAVGFDMLMGLTYVGICCSLLGTKLYYTV